MNNNCVKCDATMPDERVHLGYRECVECSSVAPTNVKEWSMPEPKPQPKSKPTRRQQLYTNQVSFNDSFKQTIDTYKRKGYVVTLNYLKQLFKKNRITMQTKNNLVNTLTTIHMMNRKTRKRYLKYV